MCTVIIFRDPQARWPLRVAANRDEKQDRAAVAPKLRSRDGVKFWAPQDLVAGGTWLGVNQHGLLVALTNRFGDLPDASLRSRGLLVEDFLTCTSFEAAVDNALELEAGLHNPFHLLLATLDQAAIFVDDGASIVAHEVWEGYTILTERSFAAGDSQRPDLINSSLVETGALSSVAFDELREVLSRHADKGFEGVCVHVPARNYGTRSSVLVGLCDDDIFFSCTEGPPCAHPWIDQSTALRQAFAR